MMLMFQTLVSGVLTSVMAACAMPWQPAISPAQAAPDQQQRDARQQRAERHQQVAQRQAEDAEQQDPAAPVAVRQLAHQRGAEEHEERIDAVAEPEVEVAQRDAGAGADDARMRIGEDRRHDRVDQAEAHGVDRDRQQAGAQQLEIESGHEVASRQVELPPNLTGAAPGE
ncbi:hypothetical protein [Burkholderia gladioli]|uniref:hypothetical protein n=1 Tax=Burkholderia gladioli TaxID=28095 RepID=UPI003C7BC8CB